MKHPTKSRANGNGRGAKAKEKTTVIEHGYSTTADSSPASPLELQQQLIAHCLARVLAGEVVTVTIDREILRALFSTGNKTTH
jgi:hypothetical protein